MRKLIWTLIFLTGCPAILVWTFVILVKSAPKKLYSPNPTVLSSTASVDPLQELFDPQISSLATAADGRMHIIKNYLQRYKSPLEPFAKNLVDTSDKYSLDYRLLVAIAQQESNLCKKIPFESYNCWGFGIYGDKVLRFPDYPKAIDTVAKVLKRDYLDKGLITPEQIMAKYTPPSVSIGGPWAKGVNQFLTELQ